MDSNPPPIDPEAEPTFPAGQALQLCELLKRWEIEPASLLAPFGLTEHELEDPHRRIRFSVMGGLIERARSLTDEPGLGFYLGLQRRASMYGFLGFAAMNAGTMREALELAVQYTPVVSTALSLRLREEGGLASLIIEEHADFGKARDVAMIAFLVGLQQIGSALTGRALVGAVDVAMPEPPYFPRFAQLLPQVRFAQPVTQIVFDAAALDLPCVSPDRAALRLAREQCEHALLALGLEGSLVDRVRKLMPKDEGFRSLDEVAATLHVSARTLKRKLAAHGTTFSSLLDEERHQKAVLLLDGAPVSLAAIAQRLGYSTVGNFVRAFRKWTGKTPAAYRNARNGGASRSAPLLHH